MKHTHRGLVAVLLAGIASSAYATKWTQVASTSEGTVSIAPGSQKHTGHLASVWIRDVFATPRPAANAPASSMQAKWIIDCSLDTYRASSIIMLGAKGEPVAPNASDDDDHDIRPDSAAAAVEERICK